MWPGIQIFWNTLLPYWEYLCYTINHEFKTSSSGFCFTPVGGTPLCFLSSNVDLWQHSSHLDLWPNQGHPANIFLDDPCAACGLMVNTLLCIWFTCCLSAMRHALPISACWCKFGGYHQWCLSSGGSSLHFFCHAVLVPSLFVPSCIVLWPYSAAVFYWGTMFHSCTWLPGVSIHSTLSFSTLVVCFCFI